MRQCLELRTLRQGPSHYPLLLDEGVPQQSVNRMVRFGQGYWEFEGQVIH